MYSIFFLLLYFKNKRFVVKLEKGHTKLGSHELE